MSFLHTGADVLATYLFTTGIVTKPSDNKLWPLFLNSMPEKPDDAIAIYDAIGTSDGRAMKTGKTLLHPGFVFRFRVADNYKAVAKAAEIESALDSILRQSVAVPSRTGVASKSYYIQGAHRTSPTIPIGAEEGGFRLLYTLNGIITFGEL